MNKLLQKSLFAAALGLGCSVFVGSASAGETKCDPKKEVCECDPKTQDCGEDPAACSPGYYRNHVESWCSAGLVCPDQLGSDPGVSCQPLINSLKAGTKGAILNATADYINANCFGTAAASPCTED